MADASYAVSLPPTAGAGLVGAAGAAAGVPGVAEEEVAALASLLALPSLGSASIGWVWLSATMLLVGSCIDGPPPQRLPVVIVGSRAPGCR